MVTSTCLIVWLTISHYIVLAIFGIGNSSWSFTISVLYLLHCEYTAIIWLHLQLVNFVCSIHLGSVAMSWTCTLWTGNYWLYSHVSNEIILVSHLIKSWHQPLCFAGRVLLSVYVCFESNKNVLLGGGLFFPLWCILFVSCCTSCKNIKHVTSYH